MIQKLLKPASKSNCSEISFEDFILIENKKVKVPGIGTLIGDISQFFLKLLESYNLQTIIEQDDSLSSFIIKNYSEIPVYVNVTNVISKQILKQFNLDPDFKIKTSIYELFLNKEKKHSVNEYHLLALGLFSIDETRYFIKTASKVNAILKSFFQRRDLILAEAEIELGKIGDKYFISSFFNPMNLTILDADHKPIFDKKIPDPKKIKEIFSFYKKLIS